MVCSAPGSSQGVVGGRRRGSWWSTGELVAMVGKHIVWWALIFLCFSMYIYARVLANDYRSHLVDTLTLHYHEELLRDDNLLEEELIDLMKVKDPLYIIKGNYTLHGTKDEQIDLLLRYYSPERRGLVSPDDFAHELFFVTFAGFVLACYPAYQTIGVCIYAFSEWRRIRRADDGNDDDRTDGEEHKEDEEDSEEVALCSVDEKRDNED